MTQYVNLVFFRDSQHSNSPSGHTRGNGDGLVHKGPSYRSSGYIPRLMAHESYFIQFQDFLQIASPCPAIFIMTKGASESSCTANPWILPVY